jgi:hypothetical protein
MDVFEQIANNPLFSKSSMIFFLNKVDILERKLKYEQFKEYFPQYDGYL